MRLDQERQSTLEPKRMEYAISKIKECGFEIIYQSETQLQFKFMGHTVNFFPYSGWASGASIKDGRGIKKLIRQIK